MSRYLEQHFDSEEEREKRSGTDNLCWKRWRTVLPVSAIQGWYMNVIITFNFKSNKYYLQKNSNIWEIRKSSL